MNENWKRLIGVIREYDMIQYVRKDGEIDTYVLVGDIIKKENNIETKQGIFEVCENYNKAMYLYIKQNNGDYWRCTIHEEENNER